MPYQPRATFDNPYGPQVQFRTLDVLPPSAYYLSLDDQMLLQVYSNVPNTTINLTVRILSPQGVVEVENLQLFTSGIGTNFYSEVMTGVEGYLLSACVTAGTAPVGSTYCLVFLARAALNPNSIISAVLVAGYAGSSRYLSYPTMQPMGMLEGPGQLKTLTTSAAAGADWSFTCPNYARWRVYYVSFTLLTNPTVANRIPNVIVADALAYQTGFFSSPTQQAATLTYYYSMNPGASGAVNVPFVNLSAAMEVVIPAGGSIHTYTLNLQATDQYSSIAMQVEEWVGL